MISDKNLEVNTINRYFNKFNKNNRQEIKSIQGELIKKGFLSETTSDGKSNSDGRFGKLTKKAIEDYNTTLNKEGGFTFDNIPSTLEDKRCSAGMCKILENNKVPTTSLGIKYVDAWNMLENMNTKGNSDMVFNIYDDKAFNKLNSDSSESEIKKITSDVKKRKQTKASDYKVGDIVGIYWPGSEHHKETLNSITHNTHSGFVSDIKNGVPIITHNVGGKVKQQPYTQLQTGWISRPNSNVVVESKYDGSDYENVDLDKNLYSNFENKIEKKLNPKAKYNSKTIPEILNSSVDPKWLEAATFGITGVETGGGINAPREIKDLTTGSTEKILRGFAYAYKGKTDEDISLGVGKAKLKNIDNFAKKYFDVNTVEDLADDNKTVDIISYQLVKNYEIFKDYAKQYPQLKLKDQDVKNMAILAYNQGTNILLKTGRSTTNPKSSKEQLAALKKLYKGTVADISSTNYKYLPESIKDVAYNAALTTGYEKPGEYYISKVNRYIDEIYNTGDKKYRDGGYQENSPDVNNDYNIIPSGNITMKETDGRPLKKGPILGIDNLGTKKLMRPGGEYKFPGNTVFEVPLAQKGIEVPKRNGVRLNYNKKGDVIGESSHLMKAEIFEGKWYGFPTLFQNDDNTWDNTFELLIKENEKNWMPAFEEAKRRGEVIDFGTDKETAIKFGEGSWKTKMQSGGGILTYKNNSDYFDSHARYSDNPKYNDLIRKRVYSGNWGYDPNTQELHKLNKSQQTKVDPKTKKLLEKRSDTDTKNLVAHTIPKEDAWNPYGSGLAGTTQLVTPERDKKMRQEELAHNAAISREQMNTLFSIPASTTPVGMAIMGMQGAANLATKSGPEFIKNPSWSNAGAAGLDLLMSSPLTIPAFPAGIKAAQSKGFLTPNTPASSGAGTLNMGFNPLNNPKKLSVSPNAVSSVDDVGKGFKINNENFYRSIDLDDAISSGVIRSKQSGEYAKSNPYFVEGKDFDILSSTGSGATGSKPKYIFETPMVDETGTSLRAWPTNATAEYSPYMANKSSIPISEGKIYKLNNKGEYELFNPDPFEGSWKTKKQNGGTPAMTTRLRARDYDDRFKNRYVPFAQEGYSVQSGDTFYDIADKNNISWKDLETANPGININNLALDQNIVIPKASVVAKPNPTVGTQVKKTVNKVKTPSFNFEDGLLLRQAYAESSFRPNVITGKTKSSVGALGLTQIMPATVKEMKRIGIVDDSFNPLDPKQSAQGQSAYMNWLSERPYLNKGDNSVVTAKLLGAYNAGPGTLKAALTKAKKAGVDIYETSDWITTKYLPKETVDYINKITGNNETFNKDYKKAVSNSKNKYILDLYKRRDGGDVSRDAQSFITRELNDEEAKAYIKQGYRLEEIK